MTKDELLECPSCYEGEALEYDVYYGHYFRTCTFCGGTGMLNEIQSRNLKKCREIYKKMKNEKINS